MGVINVLVKKLSCVTTILVIFYLVLPVLAIMPLPNHDTGLWYGGLPVNISNTEDAVVVLISDRLVGALKYIKEVYDALGIKYLVFRLSDALAMFPQGSEQESIRYFSRYVRYKLKYRYLLIVGDDIAIPYYYMNDETSSIEGVLKATDMYYSLLDGSWDNDGDYRLLESKVIRGLCVVTERLNDIKPDLIVGRLPFSTVSEVRNYYQRTLAVLRIPLTRVRVLLVGGILDLPGENYRKEYIDSVPMLEYLYHKYLKKLNNVIVRRMYEQGGVARSIPKDSIPLTKHNLRYELSYGGYNFIVMVMHGNGLRLVRKVWLRDDNGDGVAESSEIAYIPVLSYNDVPTIIGIPIFYIDSCLVNGYDLLNDYSLGKALLLKGALAVIAPTRTIYYRVSVTSYSDEILEYFIKYLIEEYPNFKPAISFYAAVAKYLSTNRNRLWLCSYLKNGLTYMLLGDPALMDRIFTYRANLLANYLFSILGRPICAGCIHSPLVVRIT